MSRYVTLRQASSSLGLSEDDLIDLIREGQVAAHKVEDGWAVEAKSVERFQARKQETFQSFTRIRTENMSNLDLQRRLSEKDLTIFNAEMKRKEKSVIVSYLLWFFLGWVGAHKFYLEETGVGVIYLASWAIGYFFFLARLTAVMVGVDADPSLFGMFALVLWSIMMLWDLVTLPIQINQREREIERKLLIDMSKGLGR